MPHKLKWLMFVQQISMFNQVENKHVSLLILKSFTYLSVLVLGKMTLVRSMFRTSKFKYTCS